ncbi:MAG: repair protein RecN [Gemmatimonadetes bacterium]|jgi:DNA repair protein RecN (Recombination protein N)|nr:repair protein RecN [Gemmatimonadota bacterium]
MLTELRIRNFAIIEALTLPLRPGFNVLTGETGAGKSIIVGALGLLLGERASVDLIRTGADRATVEGVFDIGDRPEITTLLDERGIDAEESLVVLRREIVAAGRARAWVNGTTVSATILAEVGRQLVNLHGQHEAQTLLDADAQRRILDAFAGSTGQCAAVHAAYDALAAARRDIADLRRRRADAEKRADYLRHVAQEIEAASLVEGEDVRLEEEARRLENAEELRELATAIASGIEGDEDTVLDRLGIVERSLASIQRIDPTLARLQELYDAAYYNLEELARELGEYESSVELDPARLDEVRRRRDLLFRLTKKHGATLADVMEVGRQARQELDLVDSADLDLRALEERERAALAALDSRAAALSAARSAAAERFGRAVDEVLPDLGMADGHFHPALVPLREIGPEGAEGIEFRVSLNVGHEERPLARVASGGELSRVMLALKTILARLDRVPTLIFDEVDAGIGGRVGLQVGETMRRVASYHQVFAITHLPQIAARGHHHILVAKGARGGVTTADVIVLEGDARVAEVARMLGGDPESDVSRAHARELLESAAALQADVLPAAGRSGAKRSRRA